MNKPRDPTPGEVQAAVVWTVGGYALLGLTYLICENREAIMNTVGLAWAWLLTLTAQEAGTALVGVGMLFGSPAGRGALKWAMVPVWGLPALAVVWLYRDSRPVHVREAYDKLGERLLERLPNGDVVHHDVRRVLVVIKGQNYSVHPDTGAINLNQKDVAPHLSRKHRFAVLAGARRLVEARRVAHEEADAWKDAGGA